MLLNCAFDKVVDTLLVYSQPELLHRRVQKEPYSVLMAHYSC